jgi:uncharacterized protein (TIGR02271 family)
MPTKEQVLEWRGEELLDRDGDKIGKIEEIYLDTDTGGPEWVLVNTGLFGTKSTFVPIRDASRESDGIHVPFEKSHVKDAPGVDPDGQLSQQEESVLYRHYDLDYDDSNSGSGVGEGGAGEGRFSRPSSGGEGAEGRDVREGGGVRASGDTDAMTRSEEELRAGTTARETGRVRLRKYVETEDVQESVPVSRETARVEREPITDANVDEAMKGPEISEAEHEVVLHEEEPVAEKRAVPKERVRLEKDTQTDEEQVSDTVRKERIEVDDSGRDR